MNRHRLFRPPSRFLALCICFVLTLPNPAFGLRQTGLEEQEVAGKPVRGKEALVTALTAGGLEEGWTIQHPDYTGIPDLLDNALVISEVDQLIVAAARSVSSTPEDLASQPSAIAARLRTHQMIGGIGMRPAVLTEEETALFNKLKALVREGVASYVRSRQAVEAVEPEESRKITAEVSGQIAQWSMSGLLTYVRVAQVVPKNVGTADAVKNPSFSENAAGLEESVDPVLFGRFAEALRDAYPLTGARATLRNQWQHLYADAVLKLRPADRAAISEQFPLERFSDWLNVASDAYRGAFQWGGWGADAMTAQDLITRILVPLVTHLRSFSERQTPVAQAELKQTTTRATEFTAEDWRNPSVVRLVSKTAEVMGIAVQPAAGLEEGKVEEAAAAVEGYMAERDIAVTIPLLQDPGRPLDVTESFPALRPVLENRGIALERVYRIPPAFFGAADRPQGSLAVFLEQGTEWSADVRAHLAAVEAGQAPIEVVTDVEAAQIVVGERDVRSDPARQILVRVQPGNARRVVTPALFAHLAQSGLLTPGAMIYLYQGDPDKDVYLFA